MKESKLEVALEVAWAIACSSAVLMITIMAGILLKAGWL